MPKPVPQLPGPPVHEKLPPQGFGDDRGRRGGGGDGRWNERNNRNRGRRNFDRNDYGGYSWERGNYPQSYEMHSPHPPSRVAIPPPTSIVSQIYCKPV